MRIIWPITYLRKNINITILKVSIPAFIVFFINNYTILSKKILYIKTLDEVIFSGIIILTTILNLMIFNLRKREFLYLKVLGFTNKKLLYNYILESLIINFIAIIFADFITIVFIKIVNIIFLDYYIKIVKNIFIISFVLLFIILIISIIFMYILLKKYIKNSD